MTFTSSNRKIRNKLSFSQLDCSLHGDWTVFKVKQNKTKTGAKRKTNRWLIHREREREKEFGILLLSLQWNKIVDADSLSKAVLGTIDYIIEMHIWVFLITNYDGKDSRHKMAKSWDEIKSKMQRNFLTLWKISPLDYNFKSVVEVSAGDCPLTLLYFNFKILRMSKGEPACNMCLVVSDDPRCLKKM